MQVQTGTAIGLAMQSAGDPSMAQDDRIAPDRIYSEKATAEIVDISLGHWRRLRRQDEAEGTVGTRTPVPTKLSERRIGYRGSAILRWFSERELSTTETRPAA